MKKLFSVSATFLCLVILLLAACEGPKPERTPSPGDSLCHSRREQAINDFDSGSFHINIDKLEGKELYAEEILFKRYGIRPQIVSGVWMCGTGRTHMDELYTACYENTLDSMMRAAYGADIYRRVSVAADSLKRIYPQRYALFDTVFPGYLFPEDSLDSILLRSVKYPPAARRDRIEGTVYVQLQFDSTGKVMSRSVVRGLRADIDSAAVNGFDDIDNVRPGFRWGQSQPGELTCPVKFVLKD